MFCILHVKWSIFILFTWKALLFAMYNNNCIEKLIDKWFIARVIIDFVADKKKMKSNLKLILILGLPSIVYPVIM